MLGTVIICYFLVSLSIFGIWLITFLNDATTSKTDSLSWVALLVAPLFWPIVLPLSNFELANKMGQILSDLNQ